MTTAVGPVIPLLTASQKEVVKKLKPLGKKTKVATVAVVKDEDNDFFAFTCTSDYANIAKSSKFSLNPDMGHVLTVERVMITPQINLNSPIIVKLKEI